MTKHISVMLEEALEFFRDLKMKTFYEGTLGAGGHASALLNAHPEIETYLGCDQDQHALEIAKERLEPWNEKVIFIHDNFKNLDRHLKEQGLESVDGFFLTWGYHPCS